MQSEEHPSEKFDSATISIAVVVVVLLIALNWPYEYVVKGHAYQQTMNVMDFIFEEHSFPRSEAVQGGFPFVYLTGKDTGTSTPDLILDWRHLALNIVLGLVATLSLLVAWLGLRRYCEGLRRRSDQLRLRLIQVTLGGGFGLGVVAAALGIWLQCARQQEAAQRLAKHGSVHLYALVPKPFAEVFPDAVWQRLSRVRSVISWRSSDQVIAEVLEVPSVTSLFCNGYCPTKSELEQLARRGNFFQLHVLNSVVSPESLEAMCGVRSLRDLALVQCRGLKDHPPDFAALSSLRTLDFSDSDLRLDSMDKASWPKSLRRLMLPRPKRGSDTLSLDGLEKLEWLVVRRNDGSINPDVVDLKLSNLPSLEYLRLETFQKFGLNLRAIPRLQSIGYADSDAIMRYQITGQVPVSLWLQSLKAYGLPSLRELYVDAVDLEELDLVGTTALRRLSLGRLAFGRGSRLRDVDDAAKARIHRIVEKIGTLEGPAIVDLSTLPLQSLDLQCLLPNERIRTLGLRYCGINGNQLRSICQLPRLLELDVRDCPIENEDVQAILDQHLPIQQLWVDFEDMKSIQIVNQPRLKQLVAGESPAVKRVEIAKSPALESELLLGDGLEQLRIQDAYSLRGISVNGPLPRDAELSGLRSLRFFAVGGPAAGDDLCRSLWTCTDLDHLTVAYGSLSRESLERIGRFKKLTVLALPGSNVDDEIVLNAWAPLAQLADVNLDHTQISGASLQRIVRLRNLQKLSINGCRLSKADVRCVTEVSQLIELEVGGIGLDEETLMACLGRGMLDRLNLSESEITPRVMDVLVGPAANSLLFLGLRGCNLSDADVVKLVDAHPRLSLDLSGNPLSEELIARLKRTDRWLDQHDRDGFLRKLANGSLNQLEDIKAEFDATRGRIDYVRFVSTRPTK